MINYPVLWRNPRIVHLKFSWGKRRHWAEPPGFGVRLAVTYIQCNLISQMDSVGRLLFLHGVSVVAANINEDLTESVSFKIWCWTYKCLRGITKGKNFPKKLGRSWELCSSSEVIPLRHLLEQRQRTPHTCSTQIRKLNTFEFTTPLLAALQVSLGLAAAFWSSNNCCERLDFFYFESVPFFSFQTWLEWQGVLSYV